MPVLITGSLSRATAIVLGLVLVLASRSVQAAIALLDPSFGGDGRVVTDMNGGTDNGRSVVVQTDGRIVVSGFDSTAQDFVLVRYHADGSLDTTFDGDGKVSTDFGGNEQAQDMALQADGKIVVVGLSNASGNFDFAVARYNTDGSLDATFDGDGRASTDLNGGASDQAFAVAIQGDGKIVVGGFSGSADFAVVRYHTNGSLDTTFSADGIVLTDFGGNDQVRALALQTDGKIVAAGFSNTPTGDVAVARYHTDGTLDTAFDADGLVTTDFSGGSDQGRAVVVQDDSKIVVAGLAPGSDFALLRYHANGSLDTSFDTDGRVITNFGGTSNDQANDMVLQPDGKLVVAGLSDVTGNFDFAVARYHTDGGLDGDFIAGGWATVDFGGSSNDQAYGIAVQTNGLLVVVGLTNTSGVFDLGVARIASDLIFTDGFESGDLSAWSLLSQTGGGDLSTSPTAALAGTTQGLRAVVNDTGGLFVRDDTPDGERRYRARFYLDPNGFDPGEAQNRRRTRVFIAFDESPMRRHVAVVLRRLSGQYALQTRVRIDDGTQVNTGFFNVTDAPHFVEVDWQRAADGASSDGTFEMWIDGISVTTLTSLANGSYGVDFVRLGPQSLKSGSAGTLRFDEFESRRLGMIGP